MRARDIFEKFFLQCKVLPNNITPVNPRKSFKLSSFVFYPLFLLKQYPVKKSKMRFKDGDKITRIAGEQTFDCGYLVEK